MSDHGVPVDPKHAILLVMDYQPGILAMLPNGDEMVARMVEAIAVARKSGMAVGYVRVAFTDEDYKTMPAHNVRFKQLADKRQMHHEAPETQVHPDLKPESGDVVVRKSRVGAFSTTDLDKQLKERKIDTLILAGISTSGVVLSTIRDASDKDYRLYVLEDGSADGDQEVHRVLTEKVFPRQAQVITINDLPKLLGK